MSPWPPSGSSRVLVTLRPCRAAEARADAAGAPAPTRGTALSDTAGNETAEHDEAGHYPAELRYTAEHEWLRLMTDRDAPVVRIGITHYAQDALGDIVFVTLPAVGAVLDAGQPLGEVESTKSVSDIYAAVAGTVESRNEALDDAPELVNTDPYGEGWLVEIRLADAAGGLDAPGLLDSTAYQALLS